MRILLSLLALSTAAWGQKASVAIVIETELGNIEATVDTAAPATAQNFLHYVDAGLYNNGIFHRTVKPDNQPNNDVKIEVIQGGPAADSKGFPPIALERTSVTGLRHKNGTLSMARSQPDSATSDFFICNRRSTFARLWRKTQSRRPGLRRFRSSHQRHGACSQNSEQSVGGPEAQTAGEDPQDQPPLIPGPESW
jgi:cyclophilin family peptidyl-prolyl cis-trans isomerase